MKTLMLALLFCGLLAVITPTHAEDKKSAEDQLRALVEKVQIKLKANKRTESDLADELKEFDTLILEHKTEKTEEVARIFLMKAMLYVQVLELPDKGVPLIKQVQKDFPETEVAKRADKLLASIESQAEITKIRSQLSIGSGFPNFEEKASDGQPLSIAAFKGKIVLVDFWATWCGPCIAELPNVLKAFEKYHSKGLEIVGISLDEDKEKFAAFLKQHSMLWPQYFDGKGWQNKLAAKYGVNSIPATYLLDKEGKIIAKDLRGEALLTELEKLLGK